MRITQYGENLIQLTRLTAFNCFLVREADSFTLVDTGMSGSAQGILDTAKQYHLPIKHIVLTHAHIDHVGSVDALHALLPDVEVAISARDARFLTGDLSLDATEPQTPLRGGYPIIKTKPTRLLQPGDKIGSLEVIATPGHTPGHMSFFDRRDSTLIAGDAFSNKAGITTAGTLRLLFPFTAMATWHKPTALHSAEVLLGLQPRQLAVGHGNVIVNPLDAMKQAIAEASQKLGNSDAKKAY